MDNRIGNVLRRNRLLKHIIEGGDKGDEKARKK